MSQSSRNSSLEPFTRVAAWYFANPPTTWRIARHPLRWLIIAADGTFISSHHTKREAAANLADGRDVAAHYATLDWYLGYSRDPRLRPITNAESAIVAQIVSTVPAS